MGLGLGVQSYLEGDAKPRIVEHGMSRPWTRRATQGGLEVGGEQPNLREPCKLEAKSARKARSRTSNQEQSIHAQRTQPKSRNPEVQPTP